MNESDSQNIAEVLKKAGCEPAENEKNADLIIVNMCSVRQSAVNRVYGIVQKYKKIINTEHKIKTILTGCILMKDREKFKKFFDFILDIKTLPNWPKLLKIKSKTKKFFNTKPKYFQKNIAYVPIMTGCDNFCSYCVVPFTRGKEISIPVNEIVKKVKNLIKRNYKEIVLLGQNVNKYKFEAKNQQINFVDLLKILSDIPGDFQISFLTNHPKNFSDELIELIANSKKIKKQIHLPVQSGDNEILKRMNRGYNREEYLELIRKIQKRIPNVKISTDIIVGFPGETKKHFQNTVDLVKKIKFDNMYIAQYSPRPGTAAFKLKDNVSQKEKKRRWEILHKLVLIK